MKTWVNEGIHAREKNNILLLIFFLISFFSTTNAF